MSFSSMVSRTAGYIVKAATDWNVMVANFAALWPYDAAGKIAVSTGAADLAAIEYVRECQFQLNADIALQAGDGAAMFLVPESLNGWKLSKVAAGRESGTGVVTIQIRKVGVADMLSTRITIDSGETSSYTAAVAAVISAAQAAVATGDLIAVDVDGAGTATVRCTVSMGFMKI